MPGFLLRTLSVTARLVGAAAALIVAPQSATAVEGPPVRLDLRAEVNVTGPLVRLGDVAAIDTVDLAMLERLVALPIGPAPRTGSAEHLERAPLLRWIRARTGLSAERIVFAGATDVTVRVVATAIDGQALARSPPKRSARRRHRMGLSSGSRGRRSRRTWRHPSVW